MGMSDFGYVLKTENDEYYCGFNQFNEQLRMAKIYHSKKYAEESRQTMENRTGYAITLRCIEIMEVEND